jgi:DNA primase
MKIPERKIEEIVSKLDITDVVGRYLTLTRKGNRYWGLCPFHPEKTPSFSVVPEKGIFYCFGCHKGGSIFTFVMEMEKISFVEAVNQLAEKAGVTLEQSGSDPSLARREAMFELLGRVTKSFSYLLMKSDLGAAPRRYLEARKLDLSIIERFELGYAPADRDWLYRFLRSKNYSAEFLASSGLFSSRYAGKAFFSDRIIFPIYSHRGKVIAFGGRLLEGDGPKYLNSPESEFFKKGENLYGLYQSMDEIRKTRSFYLVEGYVDVLAMHQAGFTNAVAPLGTALTEHQARFLRRNADTALLLFDGDEAGMKATRRAIEICERVGLVSYVQELPPGSDPADVLRNEGPEALKKVLKNRINSFEYLLNKAVNGCDPETPEGKEFVINELFSYIGCVESEVRREGYIDLIAQALGVAKQSVIHDFARKSGKAVPPQERTTGGSRIGVSSDLYLLLAVTANREFFPFVRTMLIPDDLEDPRARELFIALEEAFRNEEDSVELLLGRIEEQELKTLVLDRLATEEFSINSDRVIKDAVYLIRRRSLEKKRAAVLSQLRKAGSEMKNTVKDLLAEKMYLDKELEKLKVNGNDRTTD